MRAAAVALLASLAVPAAAGAQGPPTRVTVPGFLLPVVLDTIQAEEFALEGTAGQALEAVREALREQKYEVTAFDEAQGKIGNLNFAPPRFLGGIALGRGLSCGDGQTSDAYKVWMAYLVLVTPRGEASTMRMVIAASAQDVTGSSRLARPCASFGELERRLAGRVRQLLRG